MGKPNNSQKHGITKLVVGSLVIVFPDSVPIAQMLEVGVGHYRWSAGGNENAETISGAGKRPAYAQIAFSDIVRIVRTENGKREQTIVGMSEVEAER